MTTFTRATIAIATDPPQEVQAMVRGGLAVHGSSGLYTVSHIASGKAICHSDQQRTAKGVVVELLDWWNGWEEAMLAHHGPIPDEKIAELNELLRNLTITKIIPKAKPIVAPPLELEPIYPDYFTPSEKLRALDKQIAEVLSEASTTSANKSGMVTPAVAVANSILQASTLEQREMIMVRMTTGKRAILTEDDIPIRGLVVYPLPPGIEPGYAGVKQLTGRLWALGKEIDRLATSMVNLFGESWMDFDDDPLQNFELAFWLTKEQKFTTLVQQGWCDWAVCVNLFSQLPKGEQEKVTKVLGFVGSDKQGWHAYGMKTFLRSQRLPELLRCRRAVKRALE